MARISSSRLMIYFLSISILASAASAALPLWISKSLPTTPRPRSTEPLMITGTESAASGYKTAAYYVDWAIYARHYQPADLPASILTHVIYAFANLNASSGEVVLADTYADLQKHYANDSWTETGNNVYGCVKQLYLLKKANRNMKTLLSIGGWTYSSSFGPIMATGAGRNTFAASAVNFPKNLGFDGIDIDWEYPTNSSQAENFVQLLQAVRSELDSYAATLPDNPHFYLTIASPAGPTNYEQLLVQQMDEQVDFWSLMAYDYAGSWSNVSGHDANVYASTDNTGSTPFNSQQAVDFYINNGVAPSKLLLGMLLYGRAFTNTTGPGEPYNGVGSGSWEDGIWDYKVLPQNGSQVYSDINAIASWSYDHSSQTMISYDTPDVAKLNANYIMQTGLGGGMWWDSSSDLPLNSSESLMGTVVEAFGNIEHSVYDNLRNGMPDD